MKLNQCLSQQISRKEHCNTYCACNCTLYIWHISFCQWYVMDIWYWRLKSVQRKRINCGVCSVVINVICVKGFDLFNIDAISRNPPSTPNLNKCFTKLIDDDGWFIGNKRKNIQMIPFILISAHILFMSMFQMSGSGSGRGQDDPLTITSGTGSRNHPLGPTQ